MLKSAIVIILRFVPQERQRRHIVGPGLDRSWGTADTDQRGLSAPIGVYIQGLSLGHTRGERRKAAIQQTVYNHKLLSDDTAGTPHHLQHRCAAAQPSAPGQHKTQFWVTFRNIVQTSQYDVYEQF